MEIAQLKGIKIFDLDSAKPRFAPLTRVFPVDSARLRNINKLNRHFRGQLVVSQNLPVTRGSNIFEQYFNPSEMKGISFAVLEITSESAS